MAYKMKPHSPYHGMQFIWNLSGEICPYQGFSNRTTDIELFQRIVLECRKIKPRRAPTVSSTAEMNPNGVMDTATAFAVYDCGDPIQVLEYAQKISPAKNGNVSYGTALWTIAYFNFKLFKLNRSTWENFPNLCNPLLKQELVTKTSP
jgi:hypothetical protein